MKANPALIESDTLVVQPRVFVMPDDFVVPNSTLKDEGGKLPGCVTSSFIGVSLRYAVEMLTCAHAHVHKYTNTDHACGARSNNQRISAAYSINLLVWSSIFQLPRDWTFIHHASRYIGG